MRLTLFLPTFDDGGVERMMVNIALGLAERGVEVALMAHCRGQLYLRELEGRVRLIDLPGRDDAQVLPTLIEHLRRDRPDVLLSAKDEHDHQALAARSRAGVSTRVFLRMGTTISARYQARGNPLRTWWRLRGVRRRYREADGVLCVSAGVARDLARVTGLPPARLQVVPNPVVTPRLYALAQAPLADPWLDDPVPVIVAVGRLHGAKNFPLLIEAFARLRRERAARLLILGEGRQRERLSRLAARLGVSEDLRLPGFAANPYAYLARGRLFVLSSNFEGSPNALVEALALGVPVVATDCPSGPREILQDGRFGALVPVGDAPALAQAMARTLDAPLPAETLRQAAEPYALEASVEAYLRALRPASPPST